jgi:hypothetical protein
LKQWMLKLLPAPVAAARPALRVGPKGRSGPLMCSSAAGACVDAWPCRSSRGPRPQPVPRPLAQEPRRPWAGRATGGLGVFARREERPGAPRRLPSAGPRASGAARWLRPHPRRRAPRRPCGRPHARRRWPLARRPPEAASGSASTGRRSSPRPARASETSSSPTPTRLSKARACPSSPARWRPPPGARAGRSGPRHGRRRS